ncbi:MAG: hypothetical protein ACKO96_12265, partial [Flammeovirgaceae bacterium]
SGKVTVKVSGVTATNSPIFVSSTNFKNSSQQLALTQFSGSYTGEFVYRDAKDSLATPSTGSVVVSFNGNNYTSQPANKGFPLGGNGTYTIDQNTSTITFIDKNSWQNETNMDLVLTGTYNCYYYKLESQSNSTEATNNLVLWKTTPTRLIYYNLSIK